jgi:double-stranded uracil-DNA glycosylase
LKFVPDIIATNLKILFVGFNPSIMSSQLGHHFANPRNRFWIILFKAGLTPRKLTPQEDRKLLNYGFGITNIVSRPTKSAADITTEEYEKGKVLLKKKIEQFQPKIVCYVGKGVYEKFSGRKKVSWGIQSEGVVAGAIDFVAPSSSGLVRMKLDDMIAIYKDLQKLIAHENHPPQKNED